MWINAGEKNVGSIIILNNCEEGFLKENKFPPKVPHGSRVDGNRCLGGRMLKTNLSDSNVCEDK